MARAIKLKTLLRNCALICWLFMHIIIIKQYKEPTCKKGGNKKKKQTPKKKYRQPSAASIDCDFDRKNSDVEVECMNYIILSFITYISTVHVNSISIV